MTLKVLTSQQQTLFTLLSFIMSNFFLSVSNFSGAPTKIVLLLADILIYLINIESSYAGTLQWLPFSNAQPLQIWIKILWRLLSESFLCLADILTFMLTFDLNLVDTINAHNCCLSGTLGSSQSQETFLTYLY
jgi:hypothetical protein